MTSIKKSYLDRYDRATLARTLFPNLSIEKVEKCIGDVRDGSKDNNYTRIVAVFEIGIEVSDEDAGAIIGCEPHTSNSYRWAYYTQGWKSADEMQANFNKMSRDGKRAKREAKRHALTKIGH